MQSLVTLDLAREIDRDRLRMAGYRTGREPRRHRRRARLRRAAGKRLISAGERLAGCSRSQTAATATPLRRL